VYTYYIGHFFCLITLFAAATLIPALIFIVLLIVIILSFIIISYQPIVVPEISQGTHLRLKPIGLKPLNNTLSTLVHHLSTLQKGTLTSDIIGAHVTTTFAFPGSKHGTNTPLIASLT
jgi:hypothetical protein